MPGDGLQSGEVERNYGVMRRDSGVWRMGVGFVIEAVLYECLSSIMWSGREVGSNSI